MTNRTESQNMAIENINENLAVNAGAGTGKTKVLTERYINILDKGDLRKFHEVDSIVAITFTKKATQEMKERIRFEIRNKFNEDKKWKRIYRDMEKSNISTIHSFCGNLLKENPLEADIDPMFTVVDEDKTREIISSILFDIFNKKNEYKSNFYEILLLVGEDNLVTLEKALFDIYTKSISNGINIDQLKEITLSGFDEIKIDSKDLDEKIRMNFLFLMENTKKNSKFNKLKDKEIWQEFNSNYESNRRLDILLELRNNIGSSKDYKGDVDELQKHIDKALLALELDYKWVYDEIFEVLLELDRRYSKEKAKLSILDYGDLEHKTFELLLNNKEVREKYQDKYRYIMVDEFQDTNEMQKKIFYLLSSKKTILDRNNLFIVGDPKQSIYGFRGADVNVFENVIEDISNISSKNSLKLDINFRSKDKIIDFINEVFYEIMGENYIALKSFHKSNREINIEVIENNDIEDMSDREYEAYIISKRIEELIIEGYKYKDIAILFRSRGNMKIYEDSLKKYNIPYYNEGGNNIYEKEEIIDILNILRYIANSMDKKALISYIRSPMVGVSDETIYKFIRFNNMDFTVDKDFLKIDDIEYKKLMDGIDLLEKINYKKYLYSVKELIIYIVKLTDYKSILALYDDGEQRINNLYKFIDIVEEFEKIEINTLEDFLFHIELLKKEEIKKDEAKIKTESDNVVKIMTIHKSKGLQFPVVIVPEMSKKSPNHSGAIIMNNNLGLGFKINKDMGYYKKIKDENNKRDKEELQRIFYVVLTRAEDLIILGNQGRKDGFKKLVGDLEEIEGIKFIDYPLEEIEEKSSYQKLEIEKSNIIKAPNLIEFENYKRKNFDNINISQYMTFKSCKRKFYYDYYKPLPRNIYNIEEGEKKHILDPIIRGHIVHKFCEVYNDEKDSIELLNKISNSFGVDFTKDIEKLLLPYIKNYQDFYIKNKSMDLSYDEKNFFLKMNKIYINGVIDRIYIKDDQAYIYDFKTNMTENIEALRSYYSPQLQIYSYAFEKISGLKVKKAALLLLETGEEVEIDISDKSINKNNEEIYNFIDYIFKYSNVEEYTCNSNCKNCNYKNLCE